MHARLSEVAVLLARLREQVDGLALHPELEATLRDEQIACFRPAEDGSRSERGAAILTFMNNAR